MKHRIRAALLALTLILSLSAASHAADLADDDDARFAGRTLAGLTADFMQAHDLRDSQFAVSYCNPATGEYFGQNDLQMMIAGSTYKVPLNLYYYRQELDGTLEPDAYIARIGLTLDVAHERSLVYSDNDVSEGLLYNLGNFTAYKRDMLTLFSLTEDEVDDRYFYGNYYCTRMMTDALRVLYDGREDYAAMLDLMKRAYPETGYFRRDVQEYEVAHKYGSYEGAENDVGIFFTDEPFLLAVYTQDVAGEAVCAEYARLATDYNVYHAKAHRQQADDELAAEEAALAERQAEEERLQAEAEAAERAAQEAAARARQELAAEAAQAAAEAQPAEPQTPAQPDAAEPDAPQDIPTSVFDNLTWWMFAIAFGIALLGGGILHSLLRAPGRFEERAKKKYDHLGRK